MLGRVVRVKLVISIMETLGPGIRWLLLLPPPPIVVAAAVAATAAAAPSAKARAAARLGGFISSGAAESRAPGESTRGRPERDPLLSLELPLLPLSDGGGRKRRMSVGELSLLAVSGAELSMLAIWWPGVRGLATRRLVHLNLASQALKLSQSGGGEPAASICWGTATTGRLASSLEARRVLVSRGLAPRLRLAMFSCSSC